ncbi:MAG: 16S rRNA (cytidine(1402)-2'-O)-methyltransferase [Dehalococcoidia bacterium]
MSTLYLVATPIGNLEDMSHRAIRILSEVHLIAAEDTRRTRKLLAAYGIKTPLTSYHGHSDRAKLAHLSKLLEEEDVALVSEAGMPVISDPGYELVKMALETGVSVVAVPGPSAVPVALAVSGLPADQFTHLGFLPRKKGDRRRLLGSVVAEQRTLVMFEAPHRLLASLGDIGDVLGDREIAVCRELTKMHEEVFRGTVMQAISHFTHPRGEFTVVISGRRDERRAGTVSDSAMEELRRLRREGVSAKDAVGQVSQATRLSKKVIYRAWIDLA